MQKQGNRVVLNGADMRGVIFAIYTFSQDWLGVDPMYYWNDQVPAKKTGISIPADMSRNFPPPVLSNSWQGYYHIMHYDGDKVSDVN